MVLEVVEREDGGHPRTNGRHSEVRKGMAIIIVSTGKRGEVWFTGETSPQLEQTAALARGRRCRRSGTRASELRMQKGPPGDGDPSCMLEEARGGVGLPESWPEHRRTVAVLSEIQQPGGAFGGGDRGEMEGRRWRLNGHVHYE